MDRQRENAERGGQRSIARRLPTTAEESTPPSACWCNHAMYISFTSLFICQAAAAHIFTQTPGASLPWPSAAGDDEPYPKRPGARTPVPELYNQRYSEQTFIGTHDAVAIRTPENNWSISGNQYFNVSVQLQSGVRLLQAQGHVDPAGSNEIRLCHFNCALMDGGSLHDFLGTVKGFLDDNPHEVVTLLFVNTGPPLRHWVQAYYDTGLDLMSYIPPRTKRWGNMRTADWPRISELVATNKRLITFLDRGADEDVAPYLLREFDYVFETNFVIDYPFQYSCEPSRPWWVRGMIPDRLGLVNHFLYSQFFGFRFPNATYANVTNGQGFRIGELGEHAVRCFDLYQRRPNFLLVDFFSEGEVFDVEHGLNANN